MSNKPISRSQLADAVSKGYELHDASDPRCKDHERAKRDKGFRARPDRICPACVPDCTEYTAGNAPVAKPVRKRRRATRPAA